MAVSALTLLRNRGAILFLALTLALAGCGKKGDPADAARHFFSLLAAGELATAYTESAFGFQAQQTQTAFTHNVNQLGLNQQENLTLEPPEITGDEARMPVEVTTRGGAKLPLEVTLVRESGTWRVHSLHTKRGPGQLPENRFTLVGKGAAFSGAQSRALPSEAEIQKLAHTTMSDFSDAVEEKSFTRFYDTVSVTWRKQLTIAQLERAFAPFIQAAVKIGGLSEAEMRLDGPPIISPEGLLIVNGHFNTAPYQVYYNMKFVHEQPWWKLFGLDVRLQQ